MADLDFLVEVDQKDEGCSSTEMETWSRQEVAEHRDKIAAFISDSDKAAWVYEDAGTSRLIGMILWRYRNQKLEDFPPGSAIPQLDASLFPPDGAFCEIFQLWVALDYRRQGLASRLKQQAEEELRRQGVKMLYTHTEEQNSHVIELNLKLGYREVRRGPIWDEIIRVSLIKHL